MQKTLIEDNNLTTVRTVFTPGFSMPVGSEFVSMFLVSDVAGTYVLEAQDPTTKEWFVVLTDPGTRSTVAEGGARTCNLHKLDFTWSNLRIAWTPAEVTGTNFVRISIRPAG